MGKQRVLYTFVYKENQAPHTEVTFCGGDETEVKFDSQERKMDSAELLNLLSLQCGCMYLSNLKQPQMLLLIQHKVRNIKAEDYSLREWADAAQYLSRQDCKFDSCEQA